MPDQVLFVGHSLVGPVMPAMFNSFMVSLGLAPRADAQVINGAPLRYNWDNSGSAEGVNARAVLPSGTYDAVIVTEAIPLADQIRWNDSAGYAGRYYDLAVGANPNAQFYVYETWHEMGDVGAWRAQIATDLSAWQGIVDGVGGGARLIPAGQAMGNLHDAIAAGSVPGLSSIRDLFSDTIHLNDVGTWFIAAVHAQAVAGVDASALPLQTTSPWGSSFGGPSAAAARAMADVIDQTLVDFGFGGGQPAPVSPPVTAPPEAPEDPGVEPSPPAPEPGNAELPGGPGEDVLRGGAGDDVLRGFGGNDLLVGGSGNDMLLGGPGWDIAQFQGDRESFTLTIGPDGAEVLDRRGGSEGTDTLRDVEQLQFAGQRAWADVQLAQFVGIADLNEAQLQSLVELYVAFFNRAPDAEGLAFWGTAMANGASLEQIASLFFDQTEVQSLYPSWMAVTDFATTVYANVLGRVPDADGFAFWTNALASGAVARDQFILAVIEGAKAPQTGGFSPVVAAQKEQDRQYLENKTDIGAHFALRLGMSDVENAYAVMQRFDGSDWSFDQAIDQAGVFHAQAMAGDGGEFLMPVVGVTYDFGF